MKKPVLAFIVFSVLVCAVPAWAGTFFLYLEESCNGQRGIYLTGARLGIIDTFFENGQILFDDVADKGRGSRVGTKNLAQPLAVAGRGGAEYLLAVAIDSLVEKTSAGPKAPENIKSTCAYLLYEVMTGRLLAEGSLSLERQGLADEKEREDLGFELGRQVSLALEKFF